MEQVARVYNMTHIPGAVSVRVIFMGKREWGGASIEMFKFKTPPTDNPTPPKLNDVGCTHLCFEVDDIEQSYQELVKKGVKFNCPPQIMSPEGFEEKVKATYCVDPDGITLEIVENVPM